MKMKKLVIAVFVTMFVASCSKNDDNPQTVLSIYDKPLTQAKLQRLKFFSDCNCNFRKRIYLEIKSFYQI